MPIATLHDLMVHELKDLYSAEKQLVQALPKMAKNATSEELQVAFTTHLEQTKEHVVRLEQAFETLGVSARGMKCKGMEGLIEESKSLLDEDIDPEVLDAGLIAAAQRVEHYEIAAYGAACEFARSMQHEELVELLEMTLNEEKETDALLTALAEGGVNALAQRDGQEEMGLEDDDEEAEPTNKRAASSPGRASGAGRTGGRRR
jgi:ferritin-like metal-binding protein YciE